jgi:NIPSNAP
MKLYRLSRFICFCLSVILLTALSAGARDYYQLKIYHYKTQDQETRLDQYLQQAYIPAAHRAGIKYIGVFKLVAQPDSDRKIYVFTPFSSLNKLAGIEQQLMADEKYLADGKDYIDADYKNSPYDRIETIILQAFPGMPSMAVPDLTAPKADRVYELRSYESATEKYNFNKVRMFNVGDEIGLFKRLNFNAVFYSEVISGSRMPNLMYMTTFNSKADRDKHWDTFGSDTQWKTLTAMDEYKNNVSHANIIFLHPTEYSDF